MNYKWSQNSQIDLLGHLVDPWLSLVTFTESKHKEKKFPQKLVSFPRSVSWNWPPETDQKVNLTEQAQES